MFEGKRHRIGGFSRKLRYMREVQRQNALDSLQPPYLAASTDQERVNSPKINEIAIKPPWFRKSYQYEGTPLPNFACHCQALSVDPKQSTNWPLYNVQNNPKREVLNFHSFHCDHLPAMKRGILILGTGFSLRGSNLRIQINETSGVPHAFRVLL